MFPKDQGKPRGGTQAGLRHRSPPFSVRGRYRDKASNPDVQSEHVVFAPLQHKFWPKQGMYRTLRPLSARVVHMCENKPRATSLRTPARRQVWGNRGSIEALEDNARTDNYR
ncbi:hypothetical protein VMCG_05108 [Cytospora schulzeri]|uniref:Uncharacterized protein n=1 Tax=Cytospora schulzeri TaxID=448051 RepID=A0A423WMQ7_9PEZI|nr:hypothetical protein VMCG_05108 [Valsa malicola]